MIRTVLLSKTPTGRRWGNKLPEKRKGKVIENDVWEGPIEAGQEGEYHRCVWREQEYAL